MKFNRRNEENFMYLSTMRPILNKHAFFSDTTANYVRPLEPKAYDIVTIRFRTGKNSVDNVFLVHGQETEYMELESSDEEFDYYSAECQLNNVCFQYHFEFKSGRVVGKYDSRGVVDAVDSHYEFRICPGFKTPDWAKGTVMYQIYVDRFCNGDKSNDVLTDEYKYIGENVKNVDHWYRYPETMDVRDFYGGDLQGVIDKMDYLQNLGIQVIYFNPLFVSPSNHKYDSQDYDFIDPHIGKIVVDGGELLQDGRVENKDASKYITRVTRKENLEASNQIFVELVEEAHKRGMKVIIDGVFNHCGSFNKWLDREQMYEQIAGYEKGAYISRDSKYRTYFSFHDDKWPYNYTYDGWWSHDTLPKLNFEGSKELFQYVMDIAAKWVSPPFNADGWRLDVAADLGHSPEYNHYFWKEFRKAVKQANPEALILAEHYGSTKEWLQGDEWDTVMNYDAFMEPITWFLTGMEKHSDDFRGDLKGNIDSFWGAMYHHNANFTMPSLMVAMNELSNHDHSRFLTRTNGVVGRTKTHGAQAANEGVNKAILREAVAVQMTWFGAPTIYYGDEAGLCGFTDPDNRRTYPWGREDHTLIDYHRELIEMRKSYEEWRVGSLKRIGGDYNFLCYARFNDDAQSIILINNNDHEIKKEISLWQVGVPRDTIIIRELKSDDKGYTTKKLHIPVIGGRVELVLPKTSVIILRYKVAKKACNLKTDMIKS